MRFTRSRDSRPLRRTHHTVLISLGLLVAILTQAFPVDAAEIEGVSFPETARAGDETLALYGMGLLRYRIVFRGYVGGLYLSETLVRDLEAKGEKTKGLRSDATGLLVWERVPDVARALELRYFWAIEARLFGEAADQILEQNLNATELRAIRSRLDDLNKLYRDVEEGDRYRLTYEPGRGTTLSYNGEELGTIPGRDFADAYFSIWLGKEPISKAFRDQMLRGR